MLAWRVSFALRIACLSSPSVYQKLKQGAVLGSDRLSAVVLEYDRRFAAYGDDFIFYDYNEPLSLPSSVAPQSFDFVLADPPYLSEECLSKVAKTIKYLSKGKVLLCTGEMEKELLTLPCLFLFYYFSEQLLTSGSFVGSVPQEPSWRNMPKTCWM